MTVRAFLGFRRAKCAGGHRSKWGIAHRSCIHCVPRSGITGYVGGVGAPLGYYVVIGLLRIDPVALVRRARVLRGMWAVLRIECVHRWIENAHIFNVFGVSQNECAPNPHRSKICLGKLKCIPSCAPPLVLPICPKPSPQQDFLSKVDYRSGSAYLAAQSHWCSLNVHQTHTTARFPFES